MTWMLCIALIPVNDRTMYFPRYRCHVYISMALSYSVHLSVVAIVLWISPQLSLPPVSGLIFSLKRTYNQFKRKKSFPWSRDLYNYCTIYFLQSSNIFPLCHTALCTRTHQVLEPFSNSPCTPASASSFF